MGIAEIIGTFFDGVPVLRTIWRKMWERGMEVSIEPLSPYVIQWGTLVPAIYARMRLTFTNHRSDRPERIINCRVELKKRHLLLWKRTLLSIPVHLLASSPADVGPERELTKDSILDLKIEPVSPPVSIDIFANGPSLTNGLPKWSELVLILDIVGPIRRMERTIQRVRRD